MLIFVLTKPALVEFAVFQVAPDCRRIGRFRVAGHAGRNRIRFSGRRVHRTLGPGTYRITARALPGRRAVLDTRLVVVMRPNKREISAARHADACARAASAGSAATGAFGSGTPEGKNAAAASAGIEKRPDSSGHRRGVLGARFTWTSAENSTWLLVLLGLGIALLSASALPLRIARDGRAAELLARGRGVIALAGLATLITVAVAYILQSPVGAWP
jgi:hypothetical protein